MLSFQTFSMMKRRQSRLHVSRISECDPPDESKRVDVFLESHAACSEKLDVEDHYVAWRQTHDSPNHGMTVDGPFSFCSFPFLLNPRAKSKLLHTEARCLMTQVLFNLPG